MLSGGLGLGHLIEVAMGPAFNLLFERRSE
jgi:hypothetical protein